MRKIHVTSLKTRTQPSLKRPLDGMLLLDKPMGYSSNQALQRVKRLFQARKAGHAGSLDPLATGMLPICFGRATKFSQFLLDADKHYQVTIKLGVRTTTSDSEGDIVETRDVPVLTIAQIDQVCERFRGKQMQIPSMFSALKYQGQPLYKLARQGITVEREPRPIHIYELSILNYQSDELEMSVRASKGTYIRTLADDLGQALGCGAHVSALRRLSVAGYAAHQMVTMQMLESLVELNHIDQLLIPIASIVSHLPEVTITQSMLFYLMHGQSISLAHLPSEGLVRLSQNDGKFAGVGEVQAGKISPKRLV